MHYKPFSFLEEIISLHFFKRVAYDLGNLPLMRTFAQVLQPLSSTLITVPYILKTMYDVLSIYLSLKDVLTITMPIDYRICQGNTYRGNWS